MAIFASGDANLQCVACSIIPTCDDRRWTFRDWSSDVEMFTVDAAGLTVMNATNQTVMLTLKVSGLRC
jgi:hypothetical protein